MKNICEFSNFLIVLQYKDGKYSKEGFIEMAKMVTKNDPKLMPVALELADECGLVVRNVTERCDFGIIFEVIPAIF
jgi:hypothetical protein